MAPAAPLLAVLADDDPVASDIIDAAFRRAMADILVLAGGSPSALLALLVASEVPPTSTSRFVLRLVTGAGDDTSPLAPDLAVPPGIDVPSAVVAGLRELLDTGAAVACPLFGNPHRVGTQVQGWLVALSPASSPDALERWTARVRGILEATAWVFTYGVEAGWGSWRTRGFFGSDWPRLTEAEGADCRAARDVLCGGGQSDLPASRPVDDNVQFTVYRPRRIPPDRWCPVLAFAHLAERRPDAAPDTPDPLEEVRRQARPVLGEQADSYADVTQDSGEAIPREGEITFVLDLPGLAVNPSQRSFRWVEDVQREEFRVRAPASLDGQTVRGALRVYLGALLVAEVRLAIQVDASATKAAPGDADAERARPYRRIFPSYSHRDEEIVRQVEAYARTMGDEYLRDVTHLRAGEAWNDRLLDFIRTADVFQLFWSRNSMRSPWVRQEWEYALSLGRPHFVRPTYWEMPLPQAPEQDLPPSALRALHFQRLPVQSEPPAPAAASPDAPAEAPHQIDIDRHDAERAEQLARRDREAKASPPQASPGRRRGRRFPPALAALLVVGFVGGSLMWKLPQSGLPPLLPAPPAAERSPAALETSSPDGMVLASMDDAGYIRIAARAGGEPIVIATSFRPPDVAALSVSADGSRVVCELRDGSTAAWDTRTGARIAAAPTPTAARSRPRERP
jgi:hypothetical protein